MAPPRQNTNYDGGLQAPGNYIKPSPGISPDVMTAMLAMQQSQSGGHAQSSSAAQDEMRDPEQGSRADDKRSDQWKDKYLHAARENKLNEHRVANLRKMLRTRLSDGSRPQRANPGVPWRMTLPSSDEDEPSNDDEDEDESDDDDAARDKAL
ncbi:hypothetical protein LTR53_013729 [Teratosphaeriaceae sp. CCFEE 6253]|nr:hypothetical protein LTR53_013729 [Teratosphaeriaceae sp. CCFEE 6253]